MENFFKSQHCTFNNIALKSTNRCLKCRTDVKWRESIAKSFDTGGKIDFECPLGLAINTIQEEINKKLVIISHQPKQISSCGGCSRNK